MNELDSFDKRMMQLPGILGLSRPGKHIFGDAYLVYVDESIDYMSPAYPTRHEGKRVIYYPTSRPEAL